MSKTELKLFGLAVLWYKRYVCANPDVGFGPSDESVVEIIAEETGVTPTRPEREYLLSLLSAA